MPNLAVLVLLLVSITPAAGSSEIQSDAGLQAESHVMGRQESLPAAGAVAAQHFVAVNDRYTVQQDSTLMSGTELVAVFDPGRVDLKPLSDMTSVGGTLFFWAWDMGSGVGLWKSDGTAAGTVLVKGIRPSNLTDVNGTLFFTANDLMTGIELWKSDGAEQHTVLVKDIRPDLDSPSPFELTNVNGTLFFIVNTVDTSSVVTGQELWKSDGRAEGTVLVKTLSAGTCCLSPSLMLTNVNGTLFFRALTAGMPFGLWKSDGTAEGTLFLKAINPGNGGFFDPGPNTLTDVNGTLFFTGDDAGLPGLINMDLWKSNGTEAGTVLVQDVRTAALFRIPYELTNVNGRLFYVIFDAAATGDFLEIWTSDGTAAGTTFVKVFPMIAEGPLHLTDVKGQAFFTVVDPVLGLGLWKTDGTAEGTALVKVIPLNPSSQAGMKLISVDGTLFYTGFDLVSGGELWKSDGTTTGTVLVKDIVPGPGGSYPADLTNVNGTLFFTVEVASSDTVQRRQLWASGTAATVLANDEVADGAPGTVSLVGRPSNGRLVLNPDGTFTYRPNAGFIGIDMFSYTVGDKTETSNTATVAITVAPPGSDVLFRDGFE